MNDLRPPDDRFVAYFGVVFLAQGSQLSRSDVEDTDCVASACVWEDVLEFVGKVMMENSSGDRVSTINAGRMKAVRYVRPSQIFDDTCFLGSAKML